MSVRPIFQRHRRASIRRPIGRPCLVRLEERCLMAVSITDLAAAAPDSQPYGIVGDRYGSIFFTERAAGVIARLDPGESTAVDVATLAPDSEPSGIVEDFYSNDGIWFTEFGANKIGELGGGGTASEFTVPTPNSAPDGITCTPDGAVWFTENAANKIGRIDRFGMFTEYPLPGTDTGPSQIITGTDGALYFTQTNSNQIGRMTTDGVVTEFGIPTPNSRPFGLAVGRDANTLIFSEESGNNIGRIIVGPDLSGYVTEFPIPTPDSDPGWIAGGGDGNIYFTEQNANQIGQISLLNHISEFPIPTASSGPSGIVRSSDGALDFTERNSGKIGVVALPGSLLFTQPKVQAVSGQQGYVTLGVERVGGTNGQVSVDYTTGDGTAYAGVDYTAASGTLVLANGVQSEDITIPLANTGFLLQPVLAFYVTLSNPTGDATLGTPAQAEVDVINGFPRTLSIDDVSVNDNTIYDPTYATFTLSLNAPSGLPVSVQVITADGTAVSGSDYQATNKRVTFAPGQTVLAVPVQIFDNPVAEGNQTFSAEPLGHDQRYHRQAIGHRDDHRRRHPLGGPGRDRRGRPKFALHGRPGHDDRPEPHRPERRDHRRGKN